MKMQNAGLFWKLRNKEEAGKKKVSGWKAKISER